MTEHFLICAISLERTCLSGFSFTGRGGTSWVSWKTTDFRFLDDFMVRKRGKRETPGVSGWGNGEEWNLRADHWCKPERGEPFNFLLRGLQQ